jgi:hypothetical protein
MRLHGAVHSRSVLGIACLGLAMTGSGLLGAARAEAGGSCGGNANDLFGTFVAHRAPASNAPDHADDEPLTATFSAPNQVSSDNKASRNGQTYATQKGSGTFSVQPLTWTEHGTMTIGDKSGAYDSTFKATGVECDKGTQVARFTGTFSSPQMKTTDTESYVRTS